MSEPGEADFQRQHPLSWVFPTLAAIRSTVVPAILFFVFWQGCALGWLAVFLVVPSLALGIARYLALTWALGNGELIVRDGILSRNERRLRFSRIQNLDEVQGIVHRLLGVVQVRVETASGGEPDAVLTLSPATVEVLRCGVFGRQEAEPGATERPPLLEIPLGELARLGLIRNRGFVIVAAIVGFAFQATGDFLPMPWEQSGSWFQKMVSDAVSDGRPPRLPSDLAPVTSVAGVVLLVLGAYLLLSVLSMVLAIVRFGGFTLIREGDDLTARYGLLARLRVTVPRRRIQRLQVDQTLLHRLWRRITVLLDTAGGRADGQDSAFADSSPTRGRQWLAPIATRERLEPLFAAALPTASRAPLAVAPEEAKPGWSPIDRRAVQRLFNRTMLLVLFATFGLVWVNRWALLLPPILLPLLWWICRQSIHARFYWATDDALWWRRGWPGRRLVVVPYEKIQAVVVSSTPFDRRYGMARITLDTAGSGLFPAAQIKYLKDGEAHELGRRLAREARRREFVWA